MNKYTYLLIGIVLVVVIADGGWWYFNQSTKQELKIVEIPCKAKNSTIPPDAKPIYENSEYLKDAQHVYLRRVGEAGVIPDADPVTFLPAPDQDIFGGAKDEFGMDTHHVYYAGCELSDANPGTFKYFPYTTYATDDTHFYWRWKVLSNVDAKTFLPLLQDYAKDDKVVYWEGARIQGADSATFEAYYDKASCNHNGPCAVIAQDKNHTYTMGKVTNTEAEQIINTIGKPSVQK